MAQQMEMPLEEHDRVIAYVLGLSHALNIAFFTALAESGETAPRLANLSSTTFDAQLEVAARVARENPHLYFEIQSLNPQGLLALEELLRAVQRLTDIVRADDEAAFVGLMEQGRQLSRSAAWATVQSAALPAAEQQQEQRHSHQRRDRPHRQLARREDRARDRVGQHQQRAAGKRCARHDDTVIGTGDEPHQVRHHQADEADGAGGRHRGGGQQRAQEIDARCAWAAPAGRAGRPADRRWRAR